MKVVTLNKIHVHRRGAESAEVRVFLFSVRGRKTKMSCTKLIPVSLYTFGLSAEMHNYTSLRPLRLCGELLHMRIKSNNIFWVNMEPKRVVEGGRACGSSRALAEIGRADECDLA